MTARNLKEAIQDPKTLQELTRRELAAYLLEILNADDKMHSGASSAHPRNFVPEEVAKRVEVFKAIVMVCDPNEFGKDVAARRPQSR